MILSFPKFSFQKSKNGKCELLERGQGKCEKGQWDQDDPLSDICVEFIDVRKTHLMWNFEEMR